jgi:hypothetical protein
MAPGKRKSGLGPPGAGGLAGVVGAEWLPRDGSGFRCDATWIKSGRKLLIHSGPHDPSR